MSGGLVKIVERLTCTPLALVRIPIAQSSVVLRILNTYPRQGMPPFSLFQLFEVSHIKPDYHEVCGGKNPKAT